MGTLRFLLALSVAWTHAGLPRGLSGDLCVTIFFVISGFYMAMVLSENRAYGQIIAFYNQRLLRLFPSYWTLLALSLLTAVLVPTIGHGWRAVESLQAPQAHPGILASWLLSHMFIVGQDLFLFFGLDPSGSVMFVPHLSSAQRPLADLLVIPPAWSLSLEIVFYLFAPFIARRSITVLAGLLLASCAIRLWLAYGPGLVEDPWATRFFPSEFAFFLLGMLAYRLVAERGIRPWSTAGVSYLAACAISVASLAANRFGHVKAGMLSKAAVITFGLTAAIPWRFAMTRRHRLDRRIGEYSYALYLCHVLVLELWELLAWQSPWSGYLRIAAAVAFAALLTVVVDKPVDRYHHRLLHAT